MGVGVRVVAIPDDQSYSYLSLHVSVGMCISWTGSHTSLRCRVADCLDVHVAAHMHVGYTMQDTKRILMIQLMPLCMYHAIDMCVDVMLMCASVFCVC